MTQRMEATRATTNGTTGATPPPRRPERGVAAWCVAAAVLLAVSGYYRGAQATRLADDTGYLAMSPFPLREIPKAIDSWKIVDGTETLLDAQTTRITGSTDHIMRNYRDESTGVTLSVLILYGPAGPVTPHSPQVCYPASGFAGVGPDLNRQVPYGPGKVADFLTSVFAKSGGRSMIYQTVYHSYRLNGVWSPFIDNRKLPRRNPGVFKVQVQRRSQENELRGENDPIEAFLAKLLPVIERMTAEAQPTPPAVAAAKPAPWITPRAQSGQHPSR